MMKIAATLLLLLTAAAAPLAHGDNDHVRGTVTQITASTLTILTEAKTMKTLTVNAKTAFERGGHKAAASDLKVGDRVVVDVPKNTHEARLVQFGAQKAPAAPAAHEHPAGAKK